MVRRCLAAAAVTIAALVAPAPALAQPCTGGLVAGWGNNFSGQLGDGANQDRFTGFTVAVDGLGQPVLNAASAAGGGAATYVVKCDGTVWSWGFNGTGQLGNNTNINSAVAVQVQGLTDVVAVAAGLSHAVALRRDGTVWTWGNNQFGQLGNASLADSWAPVQVTGLTDVAAVAAGAFHTLALTHSGTVWAWGANDWFQLGIPAAGSMSSVPMQVQGVSGVVAVAAGYWHSVAVTTAGDVWQWGEVKALGLPGGYPVGASPVPLSGIGGVIAVAAHGHHTVALSGGTVWTWGNNDFGQLGNGTADGIYSKDAWGDLAVPACAGPCPPLPRVPPAPVQGIRDPVIAVAAGARHTLALTSTGKVFAWGTYQWGDPSWNTVGGLSLVPVEVDGLSGTGGVASGFEHALAVYSGVSVPPSQQTWQFLTWSGEQGYRNDGVHPNSGSPATGFTFKVVYVNTAGSGAAYVNLCLDAAPCVAMAADSGADPALNDGNPANGEQYALTTTLAAGSHVYYLEASDGTTSLRLPATGTYPGPLVVDLSIILPAVVDGVQGVPYTLQPAVQGGTAPYTWAVTNLPGASGLTMMDSSTGVISGNSPVEGSYYPTLTVTDANGFSIWTSFPLVINAYTTPPPELLFDVIDLGTIGTALGSKAVAMNSSGQVVGWLLYPGYSRAFLYSQGVLTDLGHLGGNESGAVAINDAGDVVGYSSTAAGDQHAFLYRNGAMIDLGTLGGRTSWASSINDAGQVVGSSETSAGTTHAFLFDQGVMNDLGTLGGPDSNANAINSAGQIAGWSHTAPFVMHAFLYAAGVMTDLGTLAPGVTGPANISYAFALNDAGQVVGGTSTPALTTHAFRAESGTMTDLGALGTSFATWAVAVNAFGDVIGGGWTDTSAFHPFLYSSGVFTDLHTLGGVESTASAINGPGQVVGTSKTANGQRAWVYTGGTLYAMAPAAPGWQNLEAAVAINDNGQIAGTGIVNGYPHAFLAQPPRPDISLVKEVFDSGTQTWGNSTTVTNGASVQFRVTAANHGGPMTGDVTITDTLPDGLTFHSGSGCRASGQVVTCSIAAAQLAHPQASVTIDADVGNLAALGQTITLVNTATAETRDETNLADNAATAAVAVVPGPGGSTTIVGAGFTVDIVVPSPQMVANAAIGPSGQAPPAGVTFPLGVISYTVALGPGETYSPTTLTFMPPLGSPVSLSKTDVAGAVLGVIPVCSPTTTLDCWTRQDTMVSTTITLTLTDNGPFDLNPAVGVIDDPVLIGLEITPRPPKADAGPDTVVIYQAGAPVELDGSGSGDPFYQPITYRWTITSAPDGSTGTVLTGIRPSFTPGAPGTYEVSLVVNDGQLDSDPDTVVIRVADAPTPLALSRIDINTSPGDQFDPHVDGDIASYADTVSAADRRIRYYRFSTGVDAAIPNTLPDGSTSNDLLSDVQGDRIAFTRIIGAFAHSMLFTLATQELVEINPQPDAYRIGTALGGSSFVYADYSLEPNSAIVHVDLANGNTVTRLTDGTGADMNPAVSPDGGVIVWERWRTSGPLTCDVYQATFGVGGWLVSRVVTSATTNTGSPEPDTDGAVVVYSSNRQPATDGFDLFYRSVSGGGETRLRLPGDQLHPSIARGVIAFESRQVVPGQADIFLYEIATGSLFQLTSTPTVNETLNDVAVLPDGSVRLVWDADDDAGATRNVYAATVHLTDLFLTAPEVPAGIYADGVHPDRGTPSTPFTFKAVYTSRGNHAPWRSFIRVCIDGTCHDMEVDSSAPAALQDLDYTNGEQYTFTTTLAPGTHSYYFETTDNTLWARWPVGSGAFSGPVVSDLTVTWVDCNPPSHQVLCTPHFEVSGGAAPYAWSATGLPAGVVMSPATGALTGSTSPGTYAVTVSVTDTNGDVYEWAGQIVLGVGGTANHAPTANAGTDFAVNPDSVAGTQVTLLGSGSDPDGDPLTFEWSGPCGTAITATATMTCPIGTSVMTLTVSDGRGGSAADTVSIRVRALLDLALTVVTPPDTVAVGQPVEVTATVTNSGPARATQVTLSGFDNMTVADRGLPLFDALSMSVEPSGACQLPATAGGAVRCALGSIEAGQSAKVTIMGTPTWVTYAATPAGSPGMRVGATVTSGEFDLNRANNTAEGLIVMTPPPATTTLTADMRTDLATVPAGVPVTITTLVTNVGPVPATNVRLSGFRTLTAEAELGWARFDPLSASASQGTCSLPALLGDYVTCSLGTLAVGASATITLVATPTDVALPTLLGSPGSDHSRPRAGSARVGVTLDALRANEAFRRFTGSLTEFTVVAPALPALTDLALSAAAAPAIVVVGEPATLTASVTNNGPDASREVRLSGFEPLTTGAWTSLSLSASQGSCELPATPGGYVTCALGQLAPGGRATVTATAIPTEAVLPLLPLPAACPAPPCPTRTSQVRVNDLLRVIWAGAGDNTTNNGTLISFAVVQAGVVLPGSGDVTTPVGDDVAVNLLDQRAASLPITLTFPSVTQAGTSTAWPLLGGAEPPANFQVNGTMWEITTTASYTPPATVCFSGSFLATSRILHYDETGPSCDASQPSTCWVELPNQQLLPAGSGPYRSICAETDTFSPFVVGEWAGAAPAVDAGPPQMVEATSEAGAPVQFNGTADDPSGADTPLSFMWLGPCGVGFGESLTLLCPIGTNTMTLTARTSRGLSSSATVIVTVRDTTPPRIACGAPDGAWHGDNITVACTASDGGSGLAVAGDASFTLTTSVPAGTETASAFTAPRVVCDVMGNCATAGPTGPFRIDRKAPEITVAAPLDGAVYILNQKVPASYACSDGGASVVSCSGTVANAAAIDTRSVGGKTFTVTAADAVGNQVTVTRRYTVTFASGGKCLINEGHAILPPIDPSGTSTFFKGLPVLARFRVCDANGRSVGAAGVVSAFRLIGTVADGVAQITDQAVPSALQPPAWMWDPLLQAWNYVVDTRGYAGGTSYAFRITLADASAIDFRFVLK